MARNYLTSLNLNGNELQNGVVQNLGTAPSSPRAGQVYYDTTVNFQLTYNGTAWINPLARANHTGTQLASTISNLQSTVLAYPLNTFATPTANIAMGGYTLTGLNTTPTAAGQAAEYSWVLSRPLNAFAAPTGNVNLGNYNFSNLAPPTAAGQAAEYSWTLSRPLNAFAAPTGNIPMAGFTLTGLGTPTAAGQAAEYSWVVGRNLNTIAAAAPTSANVPMSGFKFTGLSTPSAAGDSAEYSWVLSRALDQFTGAISSPLNLNGYRIRNVGSPTTAGDVATNTWVTAQSLSVFQPPTANLPMAGFTLSGLATPTAAGQAAEYSWVIGQIQSAAAGIASKPPVAAIATSNISLTGLSAIDGYTPVAGDRILVTGQSNATQNGVYTAASGAWTRTTVEGPAPGEIEPGAMWLVLNGTTNAGTQWRVSTTGTITIGTTAINVVQFGAASIYTAGNGLSLTGTAFSVQPVSGGGILSGPTGIQVDTSVIPKKYSVTVGDGSTTSFVLTHNLATQDIIIQVRSTGAPYSFVECDTAATSTTTATVSFNAAPAAGAYRVTIMG